MIVAVAVAVAVVTSVACRHRLDSPAARRPQAGTWSQLNSSTRPVLRLVSLFAWVFAGRCLYRGRGLTGWEGSVGGEDGTGSGGCSHLLLTGTSLPTGSQISPSATLPGMLQSNPQVTVRMDQPRPNRVNRTLAWRIGKVSCPQYKRCEKMTVSSIVIIHIAA